jgi:hypothetical protein
MIQAGHLVDFQLHTLGWKGFQDLVGTVIAEVFGQDAKPFREVKDGGRDGAYFGEWQSDSGQTYTGSFTFQCKFCSRPRTLRISQLENEIVKARDLVTRGLATNYFIVTNAVVGPDEQEKIEQRFQSEAGVTCARVFDGAWLTQRIRVSSRLRMIVPRVYGLGDLSIILDERAYTQSQVILSMMGPDLGRLVKTDAHEAAARALMEHGFVVLLGAAAVGKSTIAASLALGALDVWKAATFVVRDVGEIIERWNPNEPRQFFWLDDGFGSCQLSDGTGELWNRSLRHLKTAIRCGARVVVTSRSHIFNAALRIIRTEEFPLLANSRVRVEVESLSRRERQQILYNHIRLGTQPTEVKVALRPHLTRLADNPSFTPETARRLGDVELTRGLSITESSLHAFVSRPVDHLLDVLRTMDANSFGALAYMFARAERMYVPLDIDVRGDHLLAALGTTQAGVANALIALRDSYVKLSFDAIGQYWTFRHPTIRDAVAEFVSQDPNLIDIYLDGTPIHQMLAEIVLGNMEVAGAKVRIGRERYDYLLARLREADEVARVRFLENRCDAEFLRRAVSEYPDLFEEALKVPHRGYAPFNLLMGLATKCQRLGVLPEQLRLDISNKICSLAFDGRSFDSSLWTDPELRPLVTESERAVVFDRLKEDFLGCIDRLIEAKASVWDRDEDPETYFDEIRDALYELESTIEFDKFDYKVMKTALVGIESEIERLKPMYAGQANYDDPDYDRELYASGDTRQREQVVNAGGTVTNPVRDVFEDVAD